MPVSRKKYILTLLLSLALLALVLAVAMLFSGGAGSDTVRDGEHPLRISEYMSSNTAFPNSEGVVCDWIEIENTSDRAFNISGYRLSDDITQARFAFPVGTVLPAGGRIVVWCTPERSGGLYAPFSIRKQGGETLLLMNSANTVLDRVDTLRAAKNTSFVRLDDGSFTVSSLPTPGYENSDSGYAAYLAAAGQGHGTLRLSEVMSAEKLISAPNGQPCDWIEVTNAGTESVDISGMHLSDREGEGRYAFPAGTVLAPGDYVVVWCSGDDTMGPEYAPFRLAKQGGETVILSDAYGSALDRIQLPFLMDDTSYARISGEWTVTDRPTPGFENSEAGYAAWVSAMGYGDVKVYISEVSARNLTGLRDADGEPQDWIELHNAGAETVSLEGWYLSDDPEKPARWRIPAVSIAPGEYKIIFASGKNRTSGEPHTDFSVSAGETVTLLTPIGIVADAVEVPLVAEDRSWARVNGEWTEAAPTPGQ